MGLDNFGSSDGDSSSTGSSDSRSSDDDTSEEFPGFNSGSTNTGGGGGSGDYPHHLVAESWKASLDYSKPYILVAEDRDGNLYTHKGCSVVMDKHTDWRRMDDHPDREFREIYHCPSQQAWLRFCNRAQDQVGTDPEELLEDDPLALGELRERVHFPKPGKPDQTRTCQLCGDTSDSKSTVILDLDLRSKPRTPVCKSHTVEELARNGLLD